MDEKLYLKADDYLRDCWRLGAAIRKSGWRPDLILALWRGGAPVGVAVHEFLKVSGWSVDHLPIKCTSYSGIGQNDGEVRFCHADDIFGALRPGQRVLVVDDVFDTGKTAVAVTARIAATGAEMRLACVYWKPMKNLTELRPDYYVADLGPNWIVFPHEIEGLTAAEVGVKDAMLADLLKDFNPPA